MMICIYIYTCIVIDDISDIWYIYIYIYVCSWVFLCNTDEEWWNNPPQNDLKSLLVDINVSLYMYMYIFMYDDDHDDDDHDDDDDDDDIFDIYIYIYDIWS